MTGQHSVTASVTALALALVRVSVRVHLRATGQVWHSGKGRVGCWGMVTA